MAKSVQTPSKAKKHQVFVGEELKAESNVYEEVIPALQELKKENVAEIKVVNHVSKVVQLYQKGRYDKNYRIVSGEYATPSTAVSEEETPAE